MRIEELSIGDWVCAEQLCGVHNEPRLTPPMKVVGLGESWVNLEIDSEQGDPFEFEPCEIRGVTITPEILEMFGFETYSQMWYHPDSYIEFFRNNRNKDVWDRTINCGEYTLYSIKYVHELQHVLRLAGVEKEIEL